MPSKRSKGAGGGRGFSGGSGKTGAGLPSRRKRLASKPPRPVEPPAARTRAAERVMRRRGTVPVRPVMLAAGALGLFLIGLGTGVGIATWADLATLVGSRPPVIAEAPPETKATPTPEPPPDRAVAETRPSEGEAPERADPIVAPPSAASADAEAEAPAQPETEAAKDAAPLEAEEPAAPQVATVPEEPDSAPIETVTHAEEVTPSESEEAPEEFDVSGATDPVAEEGPEAELDVVREGVETPDETAAAEESVAEPLVIHQPDGAAEESVETEGGLAETELTGPAPGTPTGDEVEAAGLPAEPALESGFEKEPEVVSAAEAEPAPSARPARIQTVLSEGVTLSELLPPQAVQGAPPAKPTPPPTNTSLAGVATRGPSLLAVEAPPTPTPEEVAETTETIERLGAPAAGPAVKADAVVEVEELEQEAPVAMPDDADLSAVAANRELPSSATPAADAPVEAGTSVQSAMAPRTAALSPEQILGPAATQGETPAWQRFAALPAEGAASAPMVALVIDDLGLNGPGTRRTLALPAPLTLAFLTYAPNLKRVTAAARERGHELMVHLPMEPMDAHENPGPKALLAGMDSAAIMERVNWGLSRFDGYVGVNNHMGSKFTAYGPGMAVVLAEVRRRGLLFLDSITSQDTVGGETARRLDVPYAERDIFLDNAHENPGSIRKQLAALEAVARRQGYAVGIGHPHKATLDVLSEWIPRAQARGIRLVPISAVVKHRTRLAAQSNGRAG